MTTSTSLLIFEELFTELYHAIAKREQNLVLLKVPLDSIEIGCYFRIGRILPPAFNFQTHLEGENTFVITVEY